MLGNTQVVLVALLAWAVLGERPPRAALAAIPVVFVGVVLISGVLGYGVVTGWHLRPARRDHEWRAAAVNLAGCVFFGISAVASRVEPSSGSVLDLAAANWTTAAGAACFLAGALLLLPHPHLQEA